jgi:YesN/AraC family two-component response regulator
VDNSILIVEDEALIREMLREVFVSIYQNVYSADCGESGLAVYKEHTPDLVITDIKMKKMDGLTMIGKIQEIEKKQKFIVITAYSDEEHLQRAKDLGIVNLLIKPIDLRNLIKLTRDMLNYA